MSSSSCSPSLQHVLWSDAGEANRKHTVLRCAMCLTVCTWSKPFVMQSLSVRPVHANLHWFFLPFSSFFSLLLLNLFLHIKAILCQEPRTNFSVLPWIIAKCSSFSFFSTWPGRACSHLCCIFHLYMSRHETDQSPPINLQSCFSFFALFLLFHASLCSKRSAQLSFSTLFTFCSAKHLLCLSQTACPPGTYKPEGAPGGPSTCLPCPDLQHTSQPGSTALSDCVCKPGYRPVGMTCQSEWNWCDIWFTPPGPNLPKRRRLLLTVGENGFLARCSWKLSHLFLLCDPWMWRQVNICCVRTGPSNVFFFVFFAERRELASWEHTIIIKNRSGEIVFHYLSIADLCYWMCDRALRGGSRWSRLNAYSAALQSWVAGRNELNPWIYFTVSCKVTVQSVCLLVKLRPHLFPLLCCPSGALPSAGPTRKRLLRPKRLQQPLWRSLRHTLSAWLWPPGHQHQVVPGWRHLVRDPCHLRRWGGREMRFIYVVKDNIRIE